MRNNFEEIEKEIEKKEEERLRRKHKKVQVSGKSVFALQEILKKKKRK